jgi:hypothetical protein
MFDWDKDFDDVVEKTEIKFHDPAPTSGRPGLIRGILMRWVAPAAVAGGLGLAGMVQIGAGDMPVVSASMGSLSQAFFGAPPLEMPADLLVYGEAQFTNFTRGIAGFDDRELLDLAATTLRSAGANDALLTAYSLDMLVLMHAEMARRGLERPEGAAALQDLRASYRTRVAAL